MKKYILMFLTLFLFFFILMIFNLKINLVSEGIVEKYIINDNKIEITVKIKNNEINPKYVLINNDEKIYIQKEKIINNCIIINLELKYAKTINNLIIIFYGQKVSLIDFLLMKSIFKIN